jgi:hypothetical protein
MISFPGQEERAKTPKIVKIVKKTAIPPVFGGWEPLLS